MYSLYNWDIPNFRLFENPSEWVDQHGCGIEAAAAATLNYISVIIPSTMGVLQFQKQTMLFLLFMTSSNVHHFVHCNFQILK
jgi:hypothetical protein